ncbi:VanZ family protein [Streptomyces sp. NPDC006691]|uniref:VanZ family protein n=1 Tax=Streptomyces sp. NPDC006691 TaxID=3364757 RepID=UPI003695CC02
MASEPRLQRRTWPAVAARVVVLIVGFVCMVAFAVVLAKATLVPSPASVRFTHTNVHPGDSIRAYLAQPDWKDAVKQVGGNVVLGMPFGVLLPVLFPRTRGIVRVVLMTAFVMLTVETAQGLLVTGRAFDIDDVILNSTGAFAGYLLLGRRLGRALHPRRQHWWQRRPADAGIPADRPAEATDAASPYAPSAGDHPSRDDSSPGASDVPATSKPRLPAILRAVRKPVR